MSEDTAFAIERDVNGIHETIEFRGIVQKIDKQSSDGKIKVDIRIKLTSDIVITKEAL